MTKKPPPLEGEILGPRDFVGEDTGSSFTFGGIRAGKTQRMKTLIMDQIEKGGPVHVSGRTGATKFEIKAEHVRVELGGVASDKAIRSKMKIAIAKMELDVLAQLLGQPKSRDVTPRPVPKSRRLK